MSTWNQVKLDARALTEQLIVISVHDRQGKFLGHINLEMDFAGVGGEQTGHAYYVNGQQAPYLQD
jgi:hypothetical protein